MTHRIDCKWTVAIAGEPASRIFALRDRIAGSGHGQMRCRAEPAGGAP